MNEILKEVQKLPRVEERPPLRVFHQIVDEEADHVDREEHQRVRHQLKRKAHVTDYACVPFHVPWRTKECKFTPPLRKKYALLGETESESENKVNI